MPRTKKITDSEVDKTKKSTKAKYKTDKKSVIKKADKIKEIKKKSSSELLIQKQELLHTNQKTNKPDNQEKVSESTLPSQSTEESKKAKKSLVGALSVWLTALFILIVLLVTGGSLFLIDRVWTLESKQEYTNLYRDTYSFYAKNAYEQLNNDQIASSETEINPKIDSYLDRIEKLRNQPTIPAMSSDNFKKQVDFSLTELEEYLVNYRIILGQARCVAKDSARFNEIYSSMLRSTADDSKPIEERLSGAKAFIPEISSIYRSTGECISSPELKKDFVAIADFYLGLEDSQSIDELSIEYFRKTKSNEVQRIETQFKTDSDSMQKQAQEYFDAYRSNKDLAEKK